MKICPCSVVSFFFNLTLFDFFFFFCRLWRPEAHFLFIADITADECIFLSMFFFIPANTVLSSRLHTQKDGFNLGAKANSASAVMTEECLRCSVNSFYDKREESSGHFLWATPIKICEAFKFIKPGSN